MKLIANWRDAHKFACNQIAAAAGSIEIANQVVSGFVGVVPWRWVSIASGVLALISCVARVIKQENLSAGP